jgi:hypothetical protein
MYSYYRVSYRDDPQWHGPMVELYIGRYRGDVPAPPRTLVQQNNIFVNNTTVNNTTVINNKTVNVTNVQMLTTVNQVAKTNTNIKIENISMADRQAQSQNAKQLNVVAQNRSVTETKMVAQHGGIPKATDGPRTATLAVPKAAAQAAAATPNHTATIAGKTDNLHLPPGAKTTGGGNSTTVHPVTGKIDPKHDPVTIPDKKTTGTGTGVGTGTGTTTHIDPKTGMPVQIDPKTGMPVVTPKGGTTTTTPPHKDPPKKKDMKN